MRRTVTPEILDQDLGSEKEIANSLADLGRINRWFGGVSTLCEMVRRVAEQTGRRHFTMLDVGAGSGEFARMARESLRRDEIEVDITLLERSRRHLTNKDSLPAVSGNALALPFREKRFDLVTCSTFAHHLEPEELVTFVKSGLTLARIAVVINDLRRSATHLALVYMGFPLFSSRITRHDGPASVRRAYTPDEMRKMLSKTNATRVEISTHYLYRMGAIAWAR